MKLQFDSNQDFQLDAINAAVDLFKGQPVGACDFAYSKAASREPSKGIVEQIDESIAAHGGWPIK